MGCNCKASQYIQQTEKYYKLNSEPKKGAKFKATGKSLLIWFLIIITFPIFIAMPILFLFFKKSKKIKLFNSITIRI